MKTIRYHCFKNYADELAGSHDEREMFDLLQARPDLRKLRYEMTTFCERILDGTLYIGCTSFAGDFLLAMELATGEIRSCGYTSIREENEYKIHKGLWYDQADASLVFATSTLSPISKLAHAPGGKFVRYHTGSGDLEVLGTNEPGQYTQATVYDAARGLLYFFGYRAFKFGVFDVRRREIVENIYVDSIPHVSALDDAGRCWSTWDRGNKWCCYDPEAGKFVFFDEAMATAVEGTGIMYPGAGPVDSMINGGDGYLYVGTALGELYRLDPETAKTEYLGRPTAQKRLPGLAIGPEGALYAAGGDRDVTHMLRYERGSRSWEVLGHLEAPDGTKCYRAHELVIHDGHAYVAETDNPHRSGFIWEVEL